MSITPDRKNVNAPTSRTVHLGRYDFTLIDGLWCSWCGKDLRAEDVEALDNNGSLHLCCRDCGRLILRQDLR